MLQLETYLQKKPVLPYWDMRHKTATETCALGQRNEQQLRYLLVKCRREYVKAAVTGVAHVLSRRQDLAIQTPICFTV